MRESWGIATAEDKSLERLLDGTILPEELVANPELIPLIERIYGKDALELMGVPHSEIELDSRKRDFGLISEHENSLPKISEKTEEHCNDIRKEADEFFSKNMLFFIAIGLTIRFFLAPFFIDTHDMASFFLATKDMVEGHSPYSSANYAYPPLVMIIYYPLFLFLSIFDSL